MRIHVSSAFLPPPPRPSVFNTSTLNSFIKDSSFSLACALHRGHSKQQKAILEQPTKMAWINADTEETELDLSSSAITPIKSCDVSNNSRLQLYAVHPMPEKKEQEKEQAMDIDNNETSV